MPELIAKSALQGQKPLTLGGVTLAEEALGPITSIACYPGKAEAVGEVLAGTWKTGGTKWGTKEGMNDFVKIAEFVPAEVKAEVDKVKAGLKDGSFDVFKGPIVDNTGKEVLARDAVADDAWKGDIKFYVKGVEGSIPSGK